MREDFNSIRRLRYPIPDVINPSESVCIVVRVPNNIGHIAAFWGQLFALTRWYAWEADDDHSGALLAEVWKDVYQQAKESECENVLLRTSPVNDCLLQVSYNGGELWETVYNAYGCALKAASDEFGPGSGNPASNGQPSQQPNGDNPNAGECFDLNLTINANGPTLIPLNIQSGWKFRVSEVKGAWADGSFIARWYCPNGNYFSLGACAGGSHDAGYSTDPLPAAYHMQLLYRLADGTFVQVPTDGSDYIVPSGQPAGEYWLQANDSPLNDNAGSVTLHLLACSPSGNTVGIVYKETAGGPVLASGPASVEVGQIFNITSLPGPDAIFAMFDRNVKMEILSATNYTEYPPSAGNFDYMWVDTGGTRHNVFTNTGGPFPAAWDKTVCVKQFGAVSASGQWSIQVRLNEADCT